jgi:hypothetical protein
MRGEREQPGAKARAKDKRLANHSNHRAGFEGRSITGERLAVVICGSRR